ncbi:hypothetical protein FHS43_006395 [Streptosporangium becharense]|uniref:Uncharacterized protein n=1 Tax=Streptosporangium becharense TaxID=1816182 RepID=A0A7W9MJS4_9ACTN|nr:hypothetical protein [Streptosporangium becharense]MBB2915075.1 hypothetical protein [Streptosporangium becharense]MBB5822853.1 hypothetical protein [Streptosporangium becharense]
MSFDALPDGVSSAVLHRRPGRIEVTRETEGVPDRVIAAVRQGRPGRRAA